MVWSMKGISSFLAFLFILLCNVVNGAEDVLPISPSSQRQLPSSISIETSNSIKDTRTIKEDLEKQPLSLSVSENPNSVSSSVQSSLESGTPKKKRHLEDNSLMEENDSTHKELKISKTLDSNEDYNFIKPTSTQEASSLQITATKLTASGEGKGVPVKQSGPQNSDMGNSEPSRVERAFHLEESLRGNDGANYNKIENLGTLAKIRVSGDDLEDHGPLLPQNFRRSRDEENRKANPDIQDILTGIVKILHGKANAQGDRPRQPPSRINNRGPPRIADLPPLDFDSPPTHVPAIQHKVPPPYPFDIPPSPPSTIPLPPQPSSSNKLPSHPFIKGVPLPEQLIPGQNSQEYDTISMSEPSGEMVPPFLAPHPSMNKNDTKPEFTKNKPPHKVMTGQNNVNKNGNKRVRPRPMVRPRPTNATVVKTPEAPKKPVPPVVAMKPVFEIIPDNETEVPPKVEEIKPELVPTVNVLLPTQTTEVSKIETKSPKTTESSNLSTEGGFIGIGEATPVIESSVIPELTTIQKPTPSLPTKSTSSTKYEARPGIVLDDPEFKPGGHKRPMSPHRPIITAPPVPAGGYGEIFDVTVHAIQGQASAGKPVIVPVNIGGHSGVDVSVITKPEEGQDFVSIDGKRTYINLFGETLANQAPAIAPTQAVAPSVSVPTLAPKPSIPAPPPSQPPRRPYKRPAQPAIRIDTCIVGDESTCDAAQNERCQTEEDVSSCHCRPGYNRRKHRDPCRRVVSMMTSLRVDRLYDRKITWMENFRDANSDEYLELAQEARQAMDTAMSMTPFSDDFIASRVNEIYVRKNGETNEPAIFVNMTLQLEENLDTMRPAVRHEIERHLVRAIQRKNNNVGNSNIWVDSPPGSVLALEDTDECSSRELHDCHARADCSNTFGSYRCQCHAGTRDPWTGNVHREGRQCETCPADYCNNRGECMFEHGQQVCHCTGSFYGSQCEIDGEVLGVAIGASVAAVIIIILTFICLCMWSRRWSREQKSAVGAGLGSPVFGFMANGPTVKTPNVGAPPYQISLEERMRWAQMAEVMAHANLYAQPEPGANGRTYGGYPTLNHSVNSLSLPAIAPPIPLPRLTLTGKGPNSTYGASLHGSIHHSTHGMRTSLDTTSSSEEEDKADLLGRNFLAPRPKSRTSVTNQSSIYYDVDLERADMHHKQTIPMNTYSMNSQHHRPFYR